VPAGYRQTQAPAATFVDYGAADTTFGGRDFGNQKVADVQLHKTADRTAYDGGDLVTYTLVSHNAGPSAAPDVTVDDDVPAGVVLLGDEPQPINRDFRLLNANDHPVDATLDLECLSIDTGPPLDDLAPVVNTGRTGTSAYDPAPGNDAGDAAITIARVLGSAETGAGAGDDDGHAPAPGAPAAPHASIAAGPSPAARGTSGPAPERATAPAATPVSRATVGRLRTSGSGATATTTVRCTGAARCTGTVTATARLRTRHGVRRVTLGHARYAVRAGRSDTVRIAIARAYRHAVATGAVRAVTVRAATARRHR